MNIVSNYSREFQQRVFGTIKNSHLIEQGDTVVIGVSGGPDSVCLLHVLHSLSDTLGIKLHAVHINHMLRAEEALADEEYTSALCKELNISLFIVRTDITQMAQRLGMSIEEAGREARYREFNSYARKVGAARIAVAHNRNDQAETVMMHLIRGSGIAGLTGMDYKRGALIRPLLNIAREEIEQYCEASGLSPRIDSSNLKSDFTRNRVRLELFPYIDKSFGTDVVESLYRLSAYAAQDNGYLDQCANLAYQTCLTGRKIDRTADQAVGLTADQAVGQTADRAVGQTADREIGQAADQAAGQTADQAVAQTAKQAVPQTAKQTVGQAADQAAGQTADQAVAQTAKQAVPQTAKQTVGQTEEQAADTRSDKRVSLKLDRLRELHPAILGRVLKMAICDIAGNCTGIGSVHYNMLKNLAANGRTGARAELPHSLRAYVTYGELEIYSESNPQEGKKVIKQKKSAGFEAALIVPGTTHIPELQAFLDISVENADHIDNYGMIGYNSLVQFFDYDCLKRGINIRNRRNGDIFKPFMSNGTKKLKEYFIDKKIPRERRDEIPLICVDNEIVWVIGNKISDKFKVTENTKSVLKMEYNRRTL